MPFNRANNSSSTSYADNRQDRNDVGSGLNSDVQQGSFADGSELSNISGGYGGTVTINSLDANAIDSAIELSSESIDAVVRASGEAFDLVGGVSGEAFDLVGDVNKNSIDGFTDINENANDLIKSSLLVLSDVVNGAFSFTSQAQKDATESIQKTTSEQTSMYAQSLDAVQRSVSTSLTQGNTDIIRLVMMGLVGFGLVFALIK
jgi:hypothetical protein